MGQQSEKDKSVKQSGKPAHPDKKTEPDTSEQQDKKKPTDRIEIPLISTPNDQEEMERELEEIYNEEKVTHRHGRTEPERD